MASFDVASIKERIDTFIAKYPQLDGILNQVAEKVPLEKAYIFVIALAVFIAAFYLFVGIAFVVDLIGFAYPVYASFKAIESHEKTDDKQWLTYWLVFSLFQVFEGIAAWLLEYIPFYFVFKVVFLVWCFHPLTQGATVIYDSAIAPFLLPVLGIQAEEEEVPAAPKSVTSGVEVTVESIKLLDADSQGVIFAEVIAQAPAGRSNSTIEGTIFKTRSYTGPTINSNEKITLAPLTATDGSVTIRIKEKMTYGDDQLIGEKKVSVAEIKSSQRVVLDLDFPTAEVKCVLVYKA